MKWKVQVLKDTGWQDLNPKMFTFDSGEEAAEVARKYNQNPNDCTYRSAKV